MFKELVFEISGGEPRVWHTRYFFEHPELTARMQILHAAGDVRWELVEVTGEPEAVARLAAMLERGAQPPMSGLEIVSSTPRALQYVVRWERPGPDVQYVSMEFLLHDFVGPDAIFNMRIENRRAEVKVAGPSGDKLLKFFNEARRKLEERFSVRLLRVGELRPGWDEPPRLGAGIIREEDRQLVAFALASGYYDNPKKCGVRELGDALGCSKSVVARRLRSIERRALESLVRSPDGEPLAAALGPRPEPQPGAEALTALRAGY